MNPRLPSDTYFMEIAEVVSKRSTCMRRQIGAVIVKDGQIVLNLSPTAVIELQLECSGELPEPEPGDPLGIAGLADLARDDLKVVLGAPEIPVGAYALRALDAQGIVVEPVSLEETVKAVVTKVELGEADAGIVYATDVAAAAGC